MEDEQTGRNPLQRPLSRRDLIRRAMVAGLSLPALGSLLAACGGDDDDTDDPATTAAGSPASAGATATRPADQASTPTTATTTGSPATGSPTSSGSSAGAGRVEGGDRLMGKTIEPAASEGGTLIEGSTLDLRSLNPILWNDVPSYNFGAFIFEQLVEAHPDTLEAVGNLAEGWEASEDARGWTMFLREGVTWHDGEAFDAEDVKRTYDMFMDPAAGGNQTSNLVSKVDTVEIVDQMTVRFNLKLPVADFLLDIGNLSIVAEHIWGDVASADIMTDPGATGADPSRVVGTGPFKFKEWITGDHATAVRNDDYWDGKPYLDEYIFKIVPDTSAAIAQLKTGEVDYYSFVPGPQVPELQQEDALAVVDYPALNFTFYGYQLDETKSTKFLDARVRKALLYAIDRQAIVENVYNGYAEVAVGTIPPLSWAYNPDGIKEELRYEYNPDLANQLLDEAGWLPGSDGVREKDGERLAFEMPTIAGEEVMVNMLQVYQEYWREIGVEMTPTPEPFQDLVSRITQTFDFETFLVGFNWSPPPDQSPMFACASYGAGFNVVKYCNPKVDEVLQQALVETDKEKRVQLYTDYQNLLLEDLPMAVTEFGRIVDAYNKRVHNLFPAYANTRFNTETWWVEE